MHGPGTYHWPLARSLKAPENPMNFSSKQPCNSDKKLIAFEIFIPI